MQHTDHDERTLSGGASGHFRFVSPRGSPTQRRRRARGGGCVGAEAPLNWHQLERIGYGARRLLRTGH
jgi:hypothetical protein